MSLENVYWCDYCGNKIVSENTHEQAEAEYEQRFGEPVPPPEERAILCENCIPLFEEWARKKGLIK